MKLIPATKRWTCLLDSFAMVMDVPPQELVDELGHDGGTFIWPELTEPKRRRAFHIQELLDCAWKRNWLVMPIDSYPACAPNRMVTPYIIDFKGISREERLAQYMMRNMGVLIGESLSGESHAVAWDCDTKMIYDPRGVIKPVNDFLITTFWMMIKR